MKDSFTQMIRGTKANTSEDSQTELTASTKTALSTEQDTLAVFLNKVAIAQMNGERYVETSQAIIDHFNPPARGGLRGAKYFNHGTPGVRVCAYGMAEEIEREEDVSLDQKLHGPEEGVVEGRS